MSSVVVLAVVGAAALAGAGEPIPNVIESRWVAVSTPVSIRQGAQIPTGTVVSGGAFPIVADGQAYTQRFMLQSRVTSSPDGPPFGLNRWRGNLQLVDPAATPGVLGGARFGVPGSLGNTVQFPFNPIIPGDLSPDARTVIDMLAPHFITQTTIWEWDEVNQVPLTPIPQLVGVAPTWVNVREVTVSVSDLTQRELVVRALCSQQGSLIATPYTVHSTPPPTIPQPGDDPQNVGWVCQTFNAQFVQSPSFTLIVVPTPPTASLGLIVGLLGISRRRSRPGAGQ